MSGHGGSERAGRPRRFVRLFVRYRREVDEWRNYAHDQRRHCLDVFFWTLRFERQTKPDERWHFYIGQRSSDGMGAEYRRGWGVGGSKYYHLSAHINWWLTFSVRPFYKIVYAPSFVRDMARITGQHPIEVAEHLVEKGAEIQPADQETAALSRFSRGDNE